MKTINLSFAAIFCVIAIAAFLAVIIAGAWWHLFTLFGALCITILCYNDFKSDWLRRKQDREVLTSQSSRQPINRVSITDATEKNRVAIKE